MTTRIEVLAFIERHPNCSTKELAKALNASRGAIQLHTMFLHKDGLIYVSQQVSEGYARLKRWSSGSMPDAPSPNRQRERVKRQSEISLMLAAPKRINSVFQLGAAHAS